MEIIFDGERLDVEDFYTDVAQKLKEYDEGEVEVSLLTGESVTYNVVQRSGTQFITELYNDLPDNLLNDVPDKFLTCIDPEKNAYKFYKLEKKGSHIIATYGRMGTNKGELFGARSCQYDLSMFWIKYYEKINKGYIDRSDVYLDDTEPTTSKEKTKEKKTKSTNIVSSKLFSLLEKMSRHALKRARVTIPITKAIIEATRHNIDELESCKTVDGFNKVLLEIMAISQRPVETGNGMGVKKAMAHDKDEFRRIIQREKDLLKAMEGAFYGTKSQELTGSFDDYDINVWEATDKQKEFVMKHLSKDLHNKVFKIYRVIPTKQQENFNAYLERNNIKKVKMLWHGSRNENWLSIMINSLKLNPKAIITGKMFGDGIYFANSANKSWGYTSWHGTRWANGNDGIAVMGLYALAYGNPWNVTSNQPRHCYNHMWLKNHGYNSLHAHKHDHFLLNDEIIVYSENAICLQYIVVFEEKSN